MIQNMKESLVALALQNGFFLGRAAPVSEVRSLIASLRPKSIDRSLVRIGPLSDGGYLVPDDLDGLAACISPGVSAECGFDLQIANAGIPVFLLDASVDAPPVNHPLFRFSPLFLGSQTGGEYINLDDFCKRELSHLGEEDLLLQMDIEGAELDVLTVMTDELLRRFRIMVIEFHGLEHFFEPMGLRRFRYIFDRLCKFHEVVHIHPNNHSGSARIGDISVPKLMEFTFYRKDRAHFQNGTMSFPHELDVDNVQGRPALELPRCWYR